MTTVPPQIAANGAIFAEWLGVQRLAGRVLALLFERNGEIVSHVELYSTLGATGGSLCVALSQLRASDMPPDWYVNHRGKGYRLTEAGAEECRAALADHARRLAA